MPDRVGGVQRGWVHHPELGVVIGPIPHCEVQRHENEDHPTVHPQPDRQEGEERHGGGDCRQHPDRQRFAEEVVDAVPRGEVAVGHLPEPGVKEPVRHVDRPDDEREEQVDDVGEVLDPPRFGEHPHPHHRHQRGVEAQEVRPKPRWLALHPAADHPLSPPQSKPRLRAVMASSRAIGIDQERWDSAADGIRDGPQ